MLVLRLLSIKLPNLQLEVIPGHRIGLGVGDLQRSLVDDLVDGPDHVGITTVQGALQDGVVQNRVTMEWSAAR